MTNYLTLVIYVNAYKHENQGWLLGILLFISTKKW